MFNATQFCTDHNIEVSPSQDKHTRPGWVHIRCPLCQSSSYQGGFNLKRGYYACFTCGGAWIPNVIAALLNTPLGGAIRLFKQYSTNTPAIYSLEVTSFTRPATITLPPDSSYLKDTHLAYLRSRSFSQHTVRTWDLMSTGHLGHYSHRILAPVYFGGKIVTYQCRAISPDQSPPYLACADKDEVIHHKHIVYGYDYAAPFKQCVVVEGITDVWRLGKGAVATFGKKYTREQLLLIASHFERVFVLLDPDVYDPDWDISNALMGLGVEAETIWLNPDKGDPGGLSAGEAKLLMQDLGF